ncbi:hypothetical protein BTO09_06510 [Gilvibacter sp. SZ-19]|uniref:hypothetical protein n=1 Tax=Gilvibacter sp. SZ-19 TaxID=754429 RepID=UPI000B3C3C37|nr:hypothetical protein [Gilvibacter sp. SZ-19]ARV12019.1 hypothetical protein BTO09_06510 [Gilvibacter sp. SZ-19]
MTTIYSEQQLLDEIAIFPEDYPQWNKILKSGLNICINISDDDLDEKLINPEDPIFLAHQASASMPLPVALESFIADIKADLTRTLEKPRSIFLLDIDEAVALNARQDLGMAIYSVNNLPEKILDFSYSVDLDKNQNIQNNWKGIITFEKALSNSLIVTDNFYFSNEDDGINRGFSNLFNFLDAYLPDSLAVEYQIAVFANDYNKPEEWWIKAYGQLLAKIRGLRPYDIHLELILAQTIHRRRLISNYVIGKMDHGYDLFHARKVDVVNLDNEFEHYEVFSNLDNLGTKYFQAASNTLGKLETKCATLSAFVKANGNTAERMLFGCNKDKTIKNRLLN